MLVFLASMALTGCQSESNTAQKAETSVKSVVQSKTERNKANAIAFYDLAFNQHKVQEAADKYIGDVYLQHNPMVADGKEAFVKDIGGFVGQAHKLAHTSSVRLPKAIWWCCTFRANQRQTAWAVRWWTFSVLMKMVKS